MSKMQICAGPLLQTGMVDRTRARVLAVATSPRRLTRSIVPLKATEQMKQHNSKSNRDEPGMMSKTSDGTRMPRIDVVVSRHSVAQRGVELTWERTAGRA
jgi:hypothetical protein